MSNVILEEKRLWRSGGNNVSGGNWKNEANTVSKCETQEQPIKKNKTAIEKCDNGDSEPPDNDSNESETEDEIKTRAKGDEFLDVMSIARLWVTVFMCSFELNKNRIKCISYRKLKRDQTVKQNLLQLVHYRHFIARTERINIRVTWILKGQLLTKGYINV
jgi:hypothetical protein